jgi:hypothetical protein
MKKRVTLIYKPLSYEESAKATEQDLMNVTFNASTQKGAPTARQQLDFQKANQTAREEAKGAALVKFSMIVTVTFDSVDEMANVDSIVKSLAGSAHITLRDAYGVQDSAFLASMPLGIPVNKFYSPFDLIKDML